MKRIRISIIFLLVTLIGAYAGPVSREEALQKAITFMTAKGMKTNGIKVAHTAPRRTATAATAFDAAATDAAYYVFNVAEESGFVVISGDDRTESVLGYSDNGSFDEATMPDHVRAWLDGYAEQMGAISDGKSQPAKVTLNRPAIAPLMKTKWTQREPFNNKIPKYDDKTLLVGCVATAAAQIMYYHRWPQGETTPIPWYKTETLEMFMPALPAITFEWDKMPLDITGTDIDNAAATLNLYVAQAVQTDLGESFSGATLSDAHKALVNYFGYNKNTQRIRRDSRPINEWHDLIYNELKNGRPVLYTGSSSGGGHAFVCDGYDGEGLYHFNWGWAGSYDGFFRLEVLNPEGSGDGGSTTAGGYSFYQQCLIDIKPSEGETQKPLFLTAQNLRVEGSTAICSIYNDNAVTSSFNFGWGLIDDNGKVTQIIESYVAKDLMPGYGYSKLTCNMKLADIPSGTHKLVPISKELNTAEWKSAVSSLSYIEVTANSRGFVQAVQHPIQKISASSFQWERMPVAKRSYGVDVTLKNDGDEFNGMLYIFVSKNNFFWGDFVDCEGAFVKAGKTDVVTLHPTFTGSGTYRVMVSTDSEGTTVVGETTVDVIAQPTGKINVKLESFTYSQSGNTVTYRAIVTNNAMQRYINGLRFNFYGGPSSQQQMPYISHYSYYDIIEPGETATITFSFDGLETGNSYAAVAYAFENTTNKTKELGISGWLDVTDTGINDIIVDDNITAPYYTLQGVMVEKPKKNELYIHNGKKIIYNK